VDGPPAPGSVLVLSHWPNSPTPARLAADTSAEIVFSWLATEGGRGAPEACSNDHLDQDGLVSLFAATRPEQAWPRRRLLAEVARAGDFACFACEEAAKVSFALASLADPQRSPLEAARAPAPYWERCASLYAELLGRLPELADRPEAHRWAFEEELAAYAVSRALLEAGRASLEERRELDLAVVRLPEGLAPVEATRFFARQNWPLHPAAVYNSTACSRVLFAAGRRYRLVFRYETWVRLASWRPPPRVELTGLARLLEAAEAGSCRWRADPVGDLEPQLTTGPGDESSLGLGRLLGLVGAHLLRAPKAWDPWGPR
jgi:hypothetical protein